MPFVSMLNSDFDAGIEANRYLQYINREYGKYQKMQQQAQLKQNFQTASDYLQNRRQKTRNNKKQWRTAKEYLNQCI